MNILQTESSPSRFPMACSAFQHADPVFKLASLQPNRSYNPLCGLLACFWFVKSVEVKVLEISGTLAHHLPQDRFDGVGGLGDHLQNVRGGVAHGDGAACHGQ